MLDYLSKLNPEQYRVATTVDGPLLILAGAGSGKTNAMTHRIAYMIKDGGVSPYSILAVTFTNKAAREMRDRVEALVGPLPGMWIQTFHSACLRILRYEAKDIGYDSNFVVYDPVDQKALIKRLIKDRNLDEKRYAPAFVLGVISDQKEKAVGPAQFSREMAGQPQYSVVAQLYEAYEEELKKNNAMDFDDLILNTVRLFEKNPDTLDRYRIKFRYIMVDEYQDTNLLQYRLVSMLAEKSRNICVVGDDDQCIYEWRGADIRNILEFENDFPGALVIKLEQNYRSTSNIIGAANSVIANNRERKAKKLWTGAEPGAKVEYYRADSDAEEARYVGAKIRALMRKEPRYKYSDFAVLYRANVQSRRFEEAFSAINMPYQVLSGLRFYDRKEIKDMMAYMRLVSNPRDDVSWLRIINEPKRGIGDKSVELLRTAAAESGFLEALSAAGESGLLSPKAAAAAADLASVITSLNAEKDNMSVGEVYDTLLVRTGYLPALQEMNTVEAEGRIENLLDFKSVIAEKEETAGEDGPLTLETFMEGLTLMADVDNHDPDEDAVTLMTLHSSKGLEFPVVFMPGMELGLFPGYRALDRGEGIEEERRLCYVGMTRAKERLFLTGAEQRMLYGKTDYCTESPFLKEIDRKYMCGDAVYDKKIKLPTENRYGSSPYSAGDYVSPIKAAAALSRETAQRKDTLAGKDVAPGTLVEHSKFGRGTVIECSGNIITVIFDGFGTKKMAKDLAPLKIVEE